MDFLLHERVRPGDRTAFAEIFDEHARVVYADAIRTTGDWALAEDVMSLTFLEAWRLRDKLREEVGSVRAWLLGIAANVMRNIARGQAVREFFVAVADRAEGLLQGGCGADRGDAGEESVVWPAGRGEHPLQDLAAVAGAGGRELLGRVAERDIVPVEYSGEVRQAVRPLPVRGTAPRRCRGR
ncbi:RNA polymerase sigma factor [Streptomyces sp. NPDC014986]|uniref:RNA polymerase sigma factor n=1 Tax=Streptomyces sp. NPDC014986 TaxID=3364934 RepID=UPI0036FC69D9